MKDLATLTHVRQADHDDMARQYADFLKRGGKPQRLRHGESGEGSLTHRQKISFRIQPSEAKRAAMAATKPKPAPKPPKAPKAPKPKALPKIARPGSQKAQILELLSAGPVSAKWLAGALALPSGTISTHLSALRLKGLIVQHGTDRRSIRWGRAA